MLLHTIPRTRVFLTNDTAMLPSDMLFASLNFHFED